MVSWTHHGFHRFAGSRVKASCQRRCLSRSTGQPVFGQRGIGGAGYFWPLLSERNAGGRSLHQYWQTIFGLCWHFCLLERVRVEPAFESVCTEDSACLKYFEAWHGVGTGVAPARVQRRKRSLEFVVGSKVAGLKNLITDVSCQARRGFRLECC